MRRLLHSYRCGRKPIVVTRDGKGQLHAFYNVCRHRAGPVAEGAGHRKLFRCRYHGWTYGLNGVLIFATETGGIQGFHADECALGDVRLDEWFNLVFANLDDGAIPLTVNLGNLSELVQRFPFAGMTLFERRTYEMKCNWKTYIDNYLEGYHVPSVHPGLNRELDCSAAVIEAGAVYVGQFVPIRNGEHSGSSG